jgi:hypothetical protein
MCVYFLVFDLRSETAYQKVVAENAIGGRVEIEMLGRFGDLPGGPEGADTRSR